MMGVSSWDCSTKESSILNFVMTIFHVFFFGFIIIADFFLSLYIYSFYILRYSIMFF